MERIERTVLSNLIHNEEYTRRVLFHKRGIFFRQIRKDIVFRDI